MLVEDLRLGLPCVGFRAVATPAPAQLPPRERRRQCRRRDTSDANSAHDGDWIDHHAGHGSSYVPDGHDSAVAGGNGLGTASGRVEDLPWEAMADDQPSTGGARVLSKMIAGRSAILRSS